MNREGIAYKVVHVSRFCHGNTFSKTRLTQNQASKIVETVLREIREELVQGGKVALRGFGEFSTRRKKERMGQNPMTGEPALISARTVVKFKAGATLKEAVK